MFISGSMGIAAALSFGAVSYFGGVMSAPATRPTVTIAAGGGGTYTNSALSFPGTQDSTAGRAYINVGTATNPDPSSPPWDIGDTDFTVRWHMAWDSTSNNTATAGSGCGGAFYSFTASHIFLDNDRLGGSEAGFGAGIFNDSDNSGATRVMFSVRNAAGSASFSLCGPLGHGDGAWREYAFTYDFSSGDIALYVDGTREAVQAASGVSGDISYDDTNTLTGQNFRLVMGNEKHNLAGVFPFTGEIDELELSRTIRYTGASYTAATTGWTADEFTAGLWHFDEGSGTSAANEEGIVSDPADWGTDITLTTGVSYVTSTAPTDPRPTVHVCSDWSTATGSTRNAVADSSSACSTPWTNVAGHMMNVEFADAATVVATSGSGLNFPATNFLRLIAYDGSPSAEGIAQLAWNDGTNYTSGGVHPSIPTLGVGDSLGIRFYIRAIYPYDALDTETHGDEWAVWPDPWSIDYRFSATNWQIDLAGMPASNPGAVAVNDGMGINASGARPLVKDSVYRVDYLVIGVASDSLRTRARVSSSQDRLLFDSEDFISSSFSNGTTLASQTFAATTQDFTTALRRFRIGLNGIAGLTTGNDGFVAFEWAAVAMCDSWCGAYPIVGSEN